MTDTEQAVTAQPREGACAKCGQQRPLFELDLNVWPWDENGNALVCVRCYSDAEQLIESQSIQDMGCWLPIRPDGWDQFAPPPRTALERAFAAGPVAGPIKCYGPPKEPDR